MRNLKKNLSSSLKGAERIAVLGIGSELRADDIAGILVAQDLEKLKNQNFKVFLGYTAPENLSGEIRKFKPTHLIMIDTADIGKKPGEVELFTPENVGGISFSTHKLPVKIMAQFLQKDIDCKVMIIGIQPKTLEFGKNISKEAKSAVAKLTEALQSVLAHTLSKV